MELNKLQESVLENLGYEEVTEEAKEVLSDITNHGADAGFSGFIYYNDTVKFFDDNRSEIMKNLEELASDLGEDALTMAAGFGCLQSQKLTPTEIASAIYESNDENETQVKNALAWFALEETARSITEH